VSNAVFPTLPGIKFRKRTVRWSTSVRESASGREYRASTGYTYPRYRYSVPMDFLRTAVPTAELATLAGFFNARGGRLDDFLYLDPEDSAVTTPQVLGTGDGVTTQYLLVRAYGGYVEPIGRHNSAPVIRVNAAVVSNYLLDDFGVVTFSAPPAVGLIIDWTGTFYYRVRFDRDETTFDELWQGVWKNDTLDLLTVKR
jgi:uncharacterized protein (TIGR02217 family)